ncbi:hypothetical protein L6452_19108 [Arctium lappa]|uniref:Uncharacterized protein n=1 Tax=Arctium lappa TaxID=4217 RepID=A0ACB9B8W9_ARCLA|nr:hypothetical protein L6452_19108 [Arctium lappa]
MPPRRNTRRRRIEEVYGDGNPPTNQPNPEISEVVQNALNSMMPGLITQVVEDVRQAGGTATPNNAGGTGITSSGTTTSTVGTQLTLHQWMMGQRFTSLSHIINTTRDIELDQIDFLATKGDSKKKSQNSSFGSQSGQSTIRQKYNS